MQADKKIVPLPVSEPADGDGDAGREDGKPSPSAPNSTRFLFKYILILMSAALLFVFLSFLSQQRQSERDWAEAQERQTQFSVSALQSIEKLQAENRDLLLQAVADRAAITGLSGHVIAARGVSVGLGVIRAARDKSAAQDSEAADKAAQEAENRLAALEALRRVEALVSARQYTAAREALRDMEERALAPYLSDTPDEAFPEELSAAEAYARLVERFGD